MPIQVAIALGIGHGSDFNSKQILCLDDDSGNKFPGTCHLKDVFFSRDKIQIGMKVPEYFHRSGTLAICLIDNSKFLE